MTLPVDDKPQDGELLPANGTKLTRGRLNSLRDVRRQMAQVYWDMRNNAIPAEVGTRLVYVLAQIGKVIEMGEIEERIQQLENFYRGQS